MTNMHTIVNQFGRSFFWKLVSCMRIRVGNKVATAATQFKLGGVKEQAMCPIKQADGRDMVRVCCYCSSTITNKLPLLLLRGDCFANESALEKTQQQGAI